MPKNTNSITIIITLEGIEERNTAKMTTKHSEEYFFTSAVRKCQRTLKWLLDFDWLLRSYDYLILTFIGLFHIHFSPPKFSILAHKMCHNAGQSDNNLF